MEVTTERIMISVLQPTYLSYMVLPYALTRSRKSKPQVIHLARPL
jgi:hypothetical protein